MVFKPVGVDDNGAFPTRVVNWLTTKIKSLAFPLDVDPDDAVVSGRRRLKLTDAPAAKGSVLDIWHYGDGTGNTTSPGQSYGLDIHNREGASRALVVHQYSNLTEAVRLDNTDSAPMIRIVNTENQVLNPGGTGSGDPLIFEDWGVVRIKLQGDGAAYLEPKDTSHGLYIKGPTTGTKSPLYIDHRAPANGLQIMAAASAAGFYPLLVGGQNYGPAINTASDGGVTLQLTKNGTGSGDVLRLINKGTGSSVIIKSATEDLVKVAANGDIEFLKTGLGPILKSADNSRWRLNVGNDGVITTTKL